jgi:hypothetical protein
MAPRYVKVPNFAVDMNSRAKPACYPRSSFYSVIFAPTMRTHRFTKFEFPLGATCKSCRQASFCLYTSSAISIRTKLTFKRLRYLLGGIRPRQTTHQILSPVGLELKIHKSGISLSSPEGDSHLCWTGVSSIQYQVIVKLHGVFSSYHG